MLEITRIDFEGSVSENMSSNVGSERRENHRNNNNRPRLSSNVARREWVPRGGNAATVPVANTPPSSDSYPGGNGGGDFGNSSVAPQGRYRGYNGGLRGQFNRQANRHRRESEKERSEMQERGANGDKDGRVSKDSSLPQLVQEIQEKLAKGSVECMICYDMVRRSAAIWSCGSCYSIFHLVCIKKWAICHTLCFLT